MNDRIDIDDYLFIRACRNDDVQLLELLLSVRYFDKKKLINI